MLNQLKSLLSYRRVKKSETSWTVQIQDKTVLYYRGGLSGRFVAIDDAGLTRFGTYDGACPSIKDAEFTVQGTHRYSSKALAMAAVDLLEKEGPHVQDPA